MTRHELGEPTPGMRPARILAPIFANNTPANVAFTKAALTAGVVGLMLENMAWIAAYPQLSPNIDDAGVIYKPEKRRVNHGGHVIEYGENWQTIPYVIYHGFGDCEDLGAWESAQDRMSAFLRHFRATGQKDPRLISQGIKSRPDIAVRKMPDGAWRAHVRVRKPDGSISDPSARLGMYAYGRTD